MDTVPIESEWRDIEFVGGPFDGKVQRMQVFTNKRSSYVYRFGNGMSYHYRLEGRFLKFVNAKG